MDYRLKKLQKEASELISKENIQLSNIENHLIQVKDEYHRVTEISKAPMVIINDIDAQFKKVTRLNSVDISFLFFATALQCVRQYIIGKLTQRVGDQEAAKNTKGHIKEHSDRHHRLYNPTLEEIITNPVPFDAIYGSKDFNLGIGGGYNHRAKTVGHDPLLGWIFGTMNIATSTVTVSEGLRTFHVLTGQISNGSNRDRISKNASTLKALEYTKNKLFFEGTEGKKIVGVSLMKEAIHLKSDTYSKASIPIPIIPCFSVELSNKIANYGIDMGNVLKISNQVGYAVLINSLVGMIHGLFYDETQYSSWNLYAVKTRKILLYSNLIASLSNVIAVAVGAACGAATDNPKVVKESLNYLDIGGILVTIYRLISDTKFITDVKEDFLKNELYDRIVGTEYDFMGG